MKELPGAVYVICPQCGEKTAHEMLKGRFGKKSGGVLVCTIKCSSCGHVHSDRIDIPKEIEVPLVVSDEKNSYRTFVALEEDETLEVGDKLLMEQYPVIITSIESTWKRVNRSTASEAQTIWAKRYDKVKVGISVNRGPTTTSVYFWVVPDEEFSIGDMVTIGGKTIALTKIRTNYGMVRRGSAEASEIRRLYGRLIK